MEIPAKFSKIQEFIVKILLEYVRKLFRTCFSSLFITSFFCFKMNLFEISSSDSDIDNILAMTRSKSRSISSDNTVDSLVDIRQKENEENEDLSSETPEEKEIKSIKDKNKSLLLEKPSIDGSIFTGENTSFPKNFYTLIVLEEGSQALDLDTLDPLDDWFYSAALQFSQLIPVTADLVYRLLFSLSKTGDDINGKVLFKLIDYFPEHFLEFPKVYQLFKLIMKKDEKLGIYPLILLRAKFFSDYSLNLLDFAILLVGGLLSSYISSNPLFYIIPNLLIDALSDTEVTPKDMMELAQDISSGIKDLPLETTGALVSFLPMDEKCCDFSINIGFSLLSLYLKCEFKGKTFNKIKKLINNIHCIKELCETEDPKNVQIASAAIALTERVVVLSTKFKGVDKKQIDRVIKELQMSLYGKRSTDYTSIKEQLHLTRVHLENISRDAFGNVPIETNPWG